MASGYVGAGTVLNADSSAGAVTVACHASTAIGDLLVVITDDPVGAPSSGNGAGSWVQLASNGAMGVWAGRATAAGGSIVLPVFDDEFGPYPVTSVILTYRGIVSVGTFTDVISPLLGPTSTTTVTGTKQTTTSNNDILLMVAAAYSVKRTATAASGGLNAAVTVLGGASNFNIGYNLDAGAAGLQPQNPVITTTGAGATYHVTASFKVPASGGTPATASWTTASTGTSVNTLSAVTTPVVKATGWGAATATAANMGLVQGATASWATAAAGTAFSVAVKTVLDDFNRANGAAGASWVDWRPADQQLRVIGNAAGPLYGGNSYGVTYWSAGFTTNQFVEATALFTDADATGAGTSVLVAPIVARFNPNNGTFIRVSYTLGAIYLEDTQDTFVTPLARVYRPCWNRGDKLRIECAGTDIRFLINGTLVAQGTQGINILGQVSPIYADGPYVAAYTGLNGAAELDDFNAGAVPAAATAMWSTASTSTAALMREMRPATAGGWSAVCGTLAAMREPAPAVAGGWAAAAGTKANAFLAVTSRAKDTVIYPSFAAFGGLDSYTNQQKGQITVDGEESVGYRLGIGNDGTKGDRVFFTIPAAKLIRNATLATDPVSRATFHCTFLSMMSWDYLTSGAAANPSGVAFKVRLASAAAWDATLSGDYGTITAKPVWLSGQTWYDGQTRGNSVWECEVDITALYNLASQAGTDLIFCLECMFTNTKWVAEIAGNSSTLAWARPRVEVNRYSAGSEVLIGFADLDTCCPTLTLTSAVGATVTWGYDEQRTPQGGVLKYAPPLPGEGIETLAANGSFTFPMLESSSRVHVSVEADYGGPGTLVFKRTFKTPQVMRPKLAAVAGLYGPSAAPTPHAIGWTDFRGPCKGPTNASCDCWYAMAKVGSTWHLYRTTDSDQGPFNWYIHSGAQPAMDSLNPPDATTSILDGNFDDVSELFHDETVGMVYVLTSAWNGGTSKYDVTLRWIDGSNEYEPETYWWHKSSWAGSNSIVGSALVYSATARPDLKLAAIGRTLDWRASADHDMNQSVIVAMVADGNLKIFSFGTYATQARAAGWLLVQPRGSPLLEWDNAVPGVITKVGMCHTLTLAGSHRLVLYAIGSGTGTVLVRPDDTTVFKDLLVDASEPPFTLVKGSWGSLSGSFARVWATETLPSTGSGHIPDRDTSMLALQMQDGTVQFRYTQDLTGPPWSVALQPANSDFDTSLTWNRTARAVAKWPALTGYTDWAQTPNGGMVSFKVSGSVITAQRVSDFLRVSDETTLDLGVAITELHVERDGFHWEGQRIPFVTKHADGYRVGTCVVGADLSRLYLPTPDLTDRFSSGKASIASIKNPTLDLRAPTAFRKLAGNNAFALGWEVDRKANGQPNTSPAEWDGVVGMMNSFGTNYFCLTGVSGERLRFLVHDTPTFGGKWTDGAYANAYTSPAYQPEMLGGVQWMVQKFATWFWTNDPPTTPMRKWNRLLDGMDYVLDGESGGGMYVVTVQSPGDAIWLAHDLNEDVTSWVANINRWAARCPWVQWTNANGELLTPDGQILSQVTLVP